MQKFGIGQPVPRSEDPRLLRGEGRYTDDINLPGQAHAVILRSPHAHGVLRGIDPAAALALPGVLAFYDGAALDEAGYGPFKCVAAFANRDGSPMVKPVRRAFARDRVRWVGDPIAIIVAETAALAKEAAELVELDIEPLPAVPGPREAIAPGAPALYDEAPDNRALDYHSGDAAAVTAAFAGAAHVTRLELANNRIVVNPLEPRSALAEYDAAAERWTVHIGCQGVFGLRNQLVDIMAVKPAQLRILTGNVGGSFGMKAGSYPEYVGLLHAARMLGRPVKWTDERSGSFLSDCHGRGTEVSAELALDAEGRFLALRVTGLADMGAYLTAMAPLMSTLNVLKNIVSIYRTPLVEVVTRCVFTNTTPVSAYRGAGRPEGNYIMERLIDRAAAEMGLSKLALRRLNHIRPEELPYKAPSGMVYDSGDFTAVLDRALEIADWAGFEARRAESRARGRLRGLGIGSFLEVTAPQGKEMGGIRFEPDGDVTIVTGTLDYGQGHATPFAQVLSAQLGIPFERIRLLQGDSDALQAGGGTGGSRSIMASGTAILEAGEQVMARGKDIAGHVLEAAAADIEFAAGRFTIAGTDRSIGLMELAQRLNAGLVLPPDVPATLDVGHVSDGVPSTFPNGCHIAEIEIDPETGSVEILRYSSVNDFGTLVNPLLVEGQAHGGIVQGIGQALMERTVYDESGQLLTGSFMDYAMPRAPDVPQFGFVSQPSPAKTNPLGVKGCGEAGCAGSLPSIMNAVVDALSPLGIDHIDMPATPHRIWQAIQAAQA
ncbi:MAG: xanthine dehydrogenase family protein molybdopterin-binding subunit, partial [Aliidongia sp.]